MTFTLPEDGDNVVLTLSTGQRVQRSVVHASSLEDALYCEDSAITIAITNEYIRSTDLLVLVPNTFEPLGEDVEVAATMPVVLPITFCAPSAHIDCKCHVPSHAVDCECCGSRFLTDDINAYLCRGCRIGGAR